MTIMDVRGVTDVAPLVVEASVTLTLSPPT